MLRIDNLKIRLKAKFHVLEHSSFNGTHFKGKAAEKKFLEDVTRNNIRFLWIEANCITFDSIRLEYDPYNMVHIIRFTFHFWLKNLRGTGIAYYHQHNIDPYKRDLGC